MTTNVDISRVGELEKRIRDLMHHAAEQRRQLDQLQREKHALIQENIILGVQLETADRSFKRCTHCEASDANARHWLAKYEAGAAELKAWKRQLGLRSIERAGQRSRLVTTVRVGDLIDEGQVIRADSAGVMVRDNTNTGRWIEGRRWWVVYDA